MLGFNSMVGSVQSYNSHPAPHTIKLEVSLGRIDAILQDRINAQQVALNNFVEKLLIEGEVPEETSTELKKAIEICIQELEVWDLQNLVMQTQAKVQSELVEENPSQAPIHSLASDAAKLFEEKYQNNPEALRKLIAPIVRTWATSTPRIQRLVATLKPLKLKTLLTPQSVFSKSGQEKFLEGSKLVQRLIELKQFKRSYIDPLRVEFEAAYSTMLEFSLEDMKYFLQP